MQSTVESKPALAYTIRPMREEEIPDLVAHFNELVEREPIEDGTTVEEFTDWYHNPMNRDLYYIARLQGESGSEGRVIGNMSFAHHEDGKAWGWFYVHPDYRLNGVGTDLYYRFVELAREAGAATMHITPNSQATLLLEFLEKRGFSLDRYFWEMRLPADQAVEAPAMPEGFTVRTFVPGQDEPLWLEARNVTFADHYGSVSRTIEEITHLSREEHFRPEGLFFAFDGDKLSSFCFTGIDSREAERLGYTIGHVHSLGTMPDYRRRGVGRGLLLYAIEYLRKHVETISLGVEGKNELALPLYEGVGFRQHKAWANMEKRV